jgi:hypothetical protein
VLTTLNTSKSAYASVRFATNKFFSRYQYQGGGQFRERFYCTLFIRVSALVHAVTNKSRELTFVARH